MTSWWLNRNTHPRCIPTCAGIPTIIVPLLPSQIQSLSKVLSSEPNANTRSLLALSRSHNPNTNSFDPFVVSSGKVWWGHSIPWAPAMLEGPQWPRAQVNEILESSSATLSSMHGFLLGGFSEDIAWRFTVWCVGIGHMNISWSSGTIPGGPASRYDHCWQLIYCPSRFNLQWQGEFLWVSFLWIYTLIACPVFFCF